MRLEGIHHITAITGDAPRNVDFYTRVLGLRMVKKTVNQDDPSVYHLFYADELGSAGADLTFFEYPGAAPGRAGRGMVHRIVWRVASEDALSFWAERLAGEGIVRRPAGGRAAALRRSGGARARAGGQHRRRRAADRRAPRGAGRARAAGLRRRARLLRQPRRQHRAAGADAELRAVRATAGRRAGSHRGGTYAYDPPPQERGLQGAGTIHHVAWACPLDEQEDWRERVVAAGARPTPVIDRFYFRSVYFREPSGVLFEIATIGPGFTSDEPLEHLGERLSLPPAYEHLRAQIEASVTPLPATRPVRSGG